MTQPETLQTGDTVHVHHYDSRDTVSLSRGTVLAHDAVGLTLSSDWAVQFYPWTSIHLVEIQPN